MEILSGGTTIILPADAEPFSIMASIWLGKGDRFTNQPVQAVLDSGSGPALSIPAALLAEMEDSLGLKFEVVDEKAEMQNADQSVDETILVLMDLVLKSSSSAPIQFNRVLVSVSKASDVVLLGMGILGHLDLVMKGGNLVLLQLSDPTKKKASSIAR